MIDNVSQAEARAHARQAKDDALVGVLEKHGLTLPKNAIEWRTDFRKGELRGLNLFVTLLCTDGVVAWALTGDERPFFCHLSNFVEDKPEQTGTAKRGGENTAKLSKAKQRVLDALESLLS